MNKRIITEEELVSTDEIMMMILWNNLFFNAQVFLQDTEEYV